MGYYIGCEEPKGKAAYLVKNHDAEILDGVSLDTIARLPRDKAIICVVDNGAFEGAGLMYDQRELDAFAFDGTSRPKTWLVMDRKTAYNLSGYKP